MEENLPRNKGDSMNTNQPVQITYGNLADQQFIQSLKKLVNHPFGDYTVSYRLLKIMDLIEAQSKQAEKVWSSIVSKVEVVSTDETNPNSPKEPKNPAEFYKLRQEFEATVCEAGNRFKIDIQDLAGAALSAVDLKYLGGVIFGLEKLEETQEGETSEKVSQEASQQALN